MDFRITGLSPAPFQPLFYLPDDKLAALGVLRYTVVEHPGSPDRIELRDALVGETVLLLNHVCQAAPTPYRATHAIYVREGATTQYDAINTVPESMRTRLLSLRAFDGAGMMLDADVVDGTRIESLIDRLFRNEAVAYIHAHNARRGCYAARIGRVGSNTD